MPERKVSLIVTAKDQTAGVFNGLTRTLGGIGSAVGMAAKAIAGVALAGTAAIGGLAAVSGSQAISVESAFAGVIKTTDGLTDSTGKLNEAGAELKGQFRDLSKEVPTAVEELMHIGELGGQLGVQKDNLIDFTRTIAAMGEATNLSTEEAASQFAQLANIMGTSQDDFGRMGSSIVELGNNMATTEADISAFASRIAGAGKISGLTEADVFGIAAAFSSVGIQAEAGGTATQKVLMAMNAAVVEGNDDLSLFADATGMSAAAFAVAWKKDAAGTFAKFVEGLGAAGDDAMGILADLGLEDQRLIRSFLSLGNAGPLVTDAIAMSNEAWTENTALANEAAQRYGTTESMISMLKNTFKDFAVTAGDAILPFLRDTITNLQPFLTEFGERLPGLMQDYVIPALERLVEIGGGVVEFITTFVGKLQEGESPLTAFRDTLAQFIPPETMAQIDTVVESVTTFVDTIVSFVTEHSAAIQAAFLAMGVAVGILAVALLGIQIAAFIAAFNPVTAIIGGVILLIGGLAAAWTEDWGGIRTTLTDVWTNTLQPAFQEIGEWLGTNIPKAIETVSGFWTETLLPALKSVWAFISDNLGPLFKALVDVELAALQLILAALAELWSDVFQPAIENVAKVFTDTVVPALNDVWSWFAEKVTPASKDANDVIDKLGKAVMNFATGALKKAVEWLGNLAEKLKKAGEAVPKVFDPHSPTPFEMGLRGISASLIGAAQSFGTFTKSFKSGQAKNFQDMAKGLKDLGQALLSVAQLSSISMGGRGGGLGNIGATLANFSTAVGQALTEIAKIDAQFGEKRIKSLRKDAQRLRQILDAVSIDLTAIKTAPLPNMTEWGGQIYTVFKAVMDTVATLKKDFGESAIKKASEIAQAASGVVGFVKPAIDSLAAMAEYKPLGSLADKAQNMADRLFEVLGVLSQMAMQYSGNAMEMAAAFYTAAKSAIDIIKPGIEALTALFEWKPVDSIADRAASFTERLLEVVGALKLAATGLDTEGVGNAGKFWAAAKSIVDVVKPGIEAITALFEWEPVGSLRSKGMEFAWAVQDIAFALQLAAEGLDAEGLTAAGLFWTAAKGVIDIVKPGVEAIKELLEWKAVGDLSERAKGFGADVLTIANELALVPSTSELPDITEEMLSFWERIKKILSSVSSGAEALKKLGEYAAVGNLPDLIATFRTQIETVILEMVKLPDSLRVGMGGAEGDPETLFAPVIGFMAALKPVFDSMKVGIDVLKNLVKLAKGGDSKVPSVSKSMTYFTTAMTTLVTTLGTTAGTLETQGISEATRFYNIAERIAGAVRGGMNLITTMAEEGVRSTPEMLNAWVTSVNQMLASVGNVGGGPGFQALQTPALAGVTPGGGIAPAGGAGTYTLRVVINHREPSGEFTEKVVDIALDRVDEFLAEVEV